MATRRKRAFASTYTKMAMMPYDLYQELIVLIENKLEEQKVRGLNVENYEFENDEVLDQQQQNVQAPNLIENVGVQTDNGPLSNVRTQTNAIMTENAAVQTDYPQVSNASTQTRAIVKGDIATQTERPPAVRDASTATTMLVKGNIGVQTAEPAVLKMKRSAPIGTSVSNTSTQTSTIAKEAFAAQPEQPQNMEVQTDDPAQKKRWLPPIGTSRGGLKRKKSALQEQQQTVDNEAKVSRQQIPTVATNDSEMILPDDIDGNNEEIIGNTEKDIHLHQCNICFSTFTRPYSLRRHLYNIHKQKPSERRKRGRPPKRINNTKATMFKDWSEAPLSVKNKVRRGSSSIKKKSKQSASGRKEFEMWI